MQPVAHFSAKQDYGNLYPGLPKEPMFCALAFLPKYKDIYAACLTCKNLSRILDEEGLWKALFQQHSSKALGKMPGQTWKERMSPLGVSRARFDYFMKDWPEDERHILFIDKPHWEQMEPRPKVHPKYYDQNEPGYIRAMIETLFIWVRDNLRGELGGQKRGKLNSQGFCEIHGSCVDQVFSNERNEPFRKGFEAKMCYEFYPNKASKEALNELDNERTLDFPQNSMEVNYCFNAKNFSGLSFYRAHEGLRPGGLIISSFRQNNDEQLQRVRMRVNLLFYNYYLKVESARSADDKLAAISSLCRALHVFHVLPDGNGRTILFAMLPKLLMENGFPPVILEDPTRFSTGYSSISEMVILLKQGMVNFQRAIEQFSGPEAGAAIGSILSSLWSSDPSSSEESDREGAESGSEASSPEESNERCKTGDAESGSEILPSEEPSEEFETGRNTGLSSEENSSLNNSEDSGQESEEDYLRVSVV